METSFRPGAIEGSAREIASALDFRGSDELGVASASASFAAAASDLGSAQLAPCAGQALRSQESSGGRDHQPLAETLGFEPRPAAPRARTADSSSGGPQTGALP